MSRTNFRTVDITAEMERLDPQIRYTGPGNNAGFAPYTFGGGRVKKFDGSWRRVAPEQPAETAEDRRSPFEKTDDGVILP